MTTLPTEPAARQPLRLWPGVAAAVLLLLFQFVVPAVAPEAGFFAAIAGMVCALAIVVWWMFFSRAPWLERLGAIVLMIAAAAATSFLIHESIATGMMGMMFGIYAFRVLALALAGWAVATRRLAEGPRRAALAATVLLACGVWTLLRTDGILGAGGSQFAWRWSPTAEENLLAQAGDEPAAPPGGVSESAGQQPLSTDGKIAIEAKTVGEPAGSPVRAADEVPATPESTASESAERLLAEHAGELPSSPAAATAAADWPGFRGPDRDGIARGVRIETDWSQSPPVELWRRPVGPGWSSLAVRGNLVYTQEQRGDDEVVACYNLTTGEPVWRHRDGARFWESNAGAGPRSTPTLANGRVYSFGATGILNALDARSGAVLWSRNAAADTGVKVPYWGFASSPLVDDDLVIAAAAGQLAAYDLASGEPRWTGPAHGDSYSSPHRLTIGGVPQIVLLSRAGATSVAPADGTLLWEYAWEGFTSLQPAQADDGEVLLATSGDTGGLGMRRLAVTNQEPAGQGSGLPNQMANGRGEPAAQGPGKPVEKASSLSRTLAQASAKPVAPGTGQPSPATPGPWTVAERWTSPGLKPYFNDFVVHQGHAYGFDGRILSCIDLADGQRQWKGGRYGNGQLVLLADQDVLLVLSDEGELALVAATPGKFTELARFRAIEGKTWNHPALAGDILLVRNDQEMAAFRLARARR